MLLSSVSSSYSATFEFLFGAGFDDMTVVTPVGGNTGTTLGEQRQILFQAVAQVWGAEIISDVPIVINASYSANLPCDSNGAVLASAKPTQVINSTDLGLPNFVPDTSYPLSLVDAITGTNIDVSNPVFPDVSDIVIEINDKVDTIFDCHQGNNFYYGINSDAPNDKIALFTIVLHEMTHGLGFISNVDTTNIPAVPATDTTPFIPAIITNGDYVFGKPFIFDTLIYDNQLNKTIPEMNNAERLQAMQNDPFLVWDGLSVDAYSSSFITDGFNGGLIRMYAPSTIETGSSISHFSPDISPNVLMEPEIQNIKYNQLDLTPLVLRDMGYKINFLFSNSFE